MQWVQLYNSDVESAFLIGLVIWDNWPLSGTQIIPTPSLSEVMGQHAYCLAAEKHPPTHTHEEKLFIFL